MKPRTVALLAVGGAGVAVATTVALLASKTQAAPTASGSTPAACPAPTPGQVAARPPQTFAVGLPQTATQLAMLVGDTLRVNLLRSGAQWQVGADDTAVLAVDKITTGPDSTAPNGTDDVVFFNAVGPGATRVSGINGGSFHVDVNVTCG